MVTIEKIFKTKLPVISEFQLKEIMRQFATTTPDQARNILQRISTIPIEEVSTSFYYINSELFNGKTNTRSSTIRINNNITTDISFNLILYFEAKSMFDIISAVCVGYEYHDNPIRLTIDNPSYISYCLDFYNI